MALAEAKRELSEKQSKKLKDQMEKEKREEAEYKRKILRSLEEDKLRRKMEKAVSSSHPPREILSPSDVQSQNDGLKSARNDAAPALTYDSSRLNIRLFDGSSIRNTFSATDTLEKVRQWVDEVK